MITSVRGMDDIFPPESAVWRKAEELIIQTFEDFGFGEVRVPVIEKAELFSRSVGETTDIVEKEMYTFADRKGELLALRPEGTASVVRAYIQQKKYATQPVAKYYYLGPMFRYERPQKGRNRQFYQYGVEVFGISSAQIDAEVIYLSSLLYQRLGLKEFSIEVNSLGCRECRADLAAKMKAYLTQYRESLCEDCVRRSEKNPLRVLDCKVKSCAPVVEAAPRAIDYLCADCRRHFDQVREGLDQLKVGYRVNSRIVRGLDYYNRTAFEVVSGALGAQNSLGGGGRYDQLVSDLGGPGIPAIGYAGGMERLVMLLQEKTHIEKTPGVEVKPFLFLAALGKSARDWGWTLINALRAKGITAEMDYEESSLSSQLKKADRHGARWVLMVGEDELKSGRLKLRDMEKKEQKEVALDRAFEEITALRKEEG